MALVPLECNPEVMTKLLHKVGVPKIWNVVDVYGLEPDLLAIVPKPVLSIILLYPITDKTEAFKTNMEEKTYDEKKCLTDGIYHIKQNVSNACGTIALMHSVLNKLDEIPLEDGFLKQFYNDSKDLDFEKRGELLCNSDGIIETHKELSQEGQTEAPEEDTPSKLHFVAFVEKNGTLYELDGRKSHPIDHGASSSSTFLEDAVRVCKEYMQSEPEDVRFNVLALVTAE